MRKAFDTVDRTSLLFKLSQLGVSHHLYEAIKSIYSKTESCVRLNDNVTNWFFTTGGVKQGDNLSPTLFDVYLNDLADELNCMQLGVKIDDDYLTILLYADDIVIIAEDEENLQRLLNKLHNWCKRWRMTVNCDKTKIVHFRRQGCNRSKFDFKLGTTSVDYAQTYKYLGCILSENLDFNITATILAEAAGRAVGSIVSKCLKTNTLKYETYTKLYNCCVIPIMDYCAGVWGFHSYDKPNTVQNRAIRSFLGVHKFTSNVAIYGDMGWTRPRIRRRLDMVKLFIRLVNMDNKRISKRILNWDWHHKGRTWSWNLRSIFKSANLEHICHYDPNYIATNFNLDSILCDIESSLKQKELESWKTDLQQQPKLRTYKIFKENFGTELYVKMSLSRSQRSFIAQLRSGVLPLCIETGRFVNTKREERLCKICDLNTIEDEEHFIFHCPKYETLRSNFYNMLDNHEFFTMSTKEKWIFLMASPKTITRFADYLQQIYFMRNEVLYSVS